VSENSLTNTNKMKTHQYNSIKPHTEILTNFDLPEYTLPNMVVKLNIHKSQLYQQLPKNDDILLTFLLSFESELMEFFKEMYKSNDTPDTKLYGFFKKLYILFQEKPIYLDIIFDKNLKNKDKSTISTLHRIRKTAKKYLIGVIVNGKNENIFKTKLSTSTLVDNLLSSFKMFMEDEQLFHKYIMEMKKLKTFKD